MLVMKRESNLGYITATPAKGGYGFITAIPYGQIAVTPASMTNYLIYGLLGVGGLVGLYVLSKQLKKH
jgi:hypothetical protein